MSEMTREEHLAWAKQRALEYVEQDDLVNALMSFASDLQKHPETANDQRMLGQARDMFANAQTPEGMRRFIEEFD